MSIQYATKESFDTYIKYLALKKHFTTANYDYHKYNGKVKASFDKFQTRSDVFFFYKLSKNRDHENLMVSNIIKNPNIWVRDLCDISSEEVYLDWKKRIDGLSYHIKEDLNKLKDDYKSNFLVPVSGQYPHLMSLFLQKQISLETFAILTNTSKTLDYWQSNIVDKLIAGDIIRLSKKYYPFLDHDNKKIQNIVKNHFFPV